MIILWCPVAFYIVVKRVTAKYFTEVCHYYPPPLLALSDPEQCHILWLTYLTADLVLTAKRANCPCLHDWASWEHVVVSLFSRRYLVRYLVPCVLVPLCCMQQSFTYDSRLASERIKWRITKQTADDQLATDLCGLPKVRLNRVWVLERVNDIEKETHW